MNGGGIMNRIVLGTVQFGLRYGIANSGGQVTGQEARRILSSAWEAGIRTLDTAVLYGGSEAQLGAVGVRDWQIITKLPAMPDGVSSAAEWMRCEVTASLSRLGVDTLDGLLLHRPAQLLDAQGQALYSALVGLREAGRVSRIGISVYGPHELDALPPSMRFDIVQAPWNVLDQRMTRSGWAAQLEASGCEFHARSIFLQGLLLMSPGARPAHFSRWNTLLGAWDDWLARHDLSPLQACLQQALAAPGVARIVVGVDSAAQLAQIVSAASQARHAPVLPAGMFTEDPALLNPAMWSTA